MTSSNSKPPVDRQPEVWPPGYEGSILGPRVAEEWKYLLSLDSPRTGPLLSTNAKTGFALNMPVFMTCRPTRVCCTVCYAALPPGKGGGYMRAPQTIRKTVDVYNFVTGWENKLSVVVQRITDECRGLRFLRVLGHGDLVRRLVDVINHVARKNPQLTLWVTTRKPELAKLLDRRAKNIVVWFSLDESPQSWGRLKKVEGYGFHFSWLRTSDAPVPEIVELVYPEQGADIPSDPRDCPADVPLERGGIERDGACSLCGFCYEPGPLPPMERIRLRAPLFQGGELIRLLRHTTTMTPEMRRRNLEEEPEDDDPRRWVFDDDDEEHDDVPVVIPSSSAGHKTKFEAAREAILLMCAANPDGVSFAHMLSSTGMTRITLQRARDSLKAEGLIQKKCIGGFPAKGQFVWVLTHR